ncbi:MAG: cysteine desulfurase [Alphaproteobacteria bacterium]|nr:cysteine desulfurase [Alphaproteobacteria bacterium]
MIFLDYNATTKLAPEVLAKMVEAYQLPLNNSSTHQLGRQARKLVEEAREELQQLLNAQSYEVIFTGSSTEATNTAMFGTDVKKIFFSAIEHSSVYECRPQGKEIVEVKALSNGLIDLADLEKKLPSDGKFLVCLMLANNETGAIQPVEEVARLVHQKGGLFHCDLVQAVGKIPVDLEKINADFASVSAHKLNGPQGVGALLVRKGLDIKPLIYGGKQEKSKRAGTTNIAGIAGFGMACKLATKSYESVKKLRDELESEIKKIGGDDVMIFATDVARLPNTSYIATRNRDAQTQIINFDLNNICVSAGPACSSGTSTESRILKAMGIAPEFSKSAIRVSMSLETTKDELASFITVWRKFYQND